jgi:hypothetical protein
VRSPRRSPALATTPLGGPHRRGEWRRPCSSSARRNVKEKECGGKSTKYVCESNLNFLVHRSNTNSSEPGSSHPYKPKTKGLISSMPL